MNGFSSRCYVSLISCRQKQIPSTLITQINAWIRRRQNTRWRKSPFERISGGSNSDANNKVTINQCGKWGCESNRWGCIHTAGQIEEYNLRTTWEQNCTRNKQKNKLLWFLCVHVKQWKEHSTRPLRNPAAKKQQNTSLAGGIRNDSSTLAT